MSQQDPIQDLTKLISRLPSLGPRSAKRIVLHLLQNKETLMNPLADQISKTAKDIITCETCGNLDSISPCHICVDPKRSLHSLCVVSSVSDLWALERSGSYKGRYHVLGGVLSALDGVSPKDLRISELHKRLQDQDISEVIFALPATVDGQSTLHYIANSIKDFDITITKLAHGVPIGGELDYLDDGTLSTALKSRSQY